MKINIPKEWIINRAAREEGLEIGAGATPPMIWWCEHHGREATHINKNGEHECDPSLAGIMLPCKVKLKL